MTNADDLDTGARNLLVHGAKVQPGESLLIVHEKPELGWYDQRICDAVVDGARCLGLDPAIIPADAPGKGDGSAVSEAAARHDCTIFLARIGDQDRFADPVPGRRAVMVYARDSGMLASAYGRTDHRAMLAMKQAVNTVLSSATRIEITCRLGTEISGAPGVAEADQPPDVSVSRFPMGVPAPVDAAGFSGRVALSKYLTPTGSQPYEPAAVTIKETVFARVEKGRLTGLDGNAKDAGNIARHYDVVSRLFGIDRNAIDSWHAGIHPACAYAANAADDPDRWSNTVFTSPRFLHFHTCGNYAPGEICWMILDPTVSVDGANLWENGRLCVSRFEPTAQCLQDWPELQSLYDRPEKRVGI